MAAISEILKREELQEPCIYLYKEGIFWKAYQYSAYRVVQRQVNFKPKKKFIKTVSCEIVSLGFPDITLERVFKKQEIEIVNEKLIGIPCGELDKKAYIEWFDNIPQVGHLVDSWLAEPNELRIRTINKEENVLRRIKEFPVEEVTPEACVNFITSIYKELIG